MFPEVTFLSVHLYVWLFALGILLAFASFRLLSSKLYIPSKLFNLCLYDAVASIAIGYIFSVLVQDVYSYIETKEWDWDSGSTFLGGLFFAAAFFHLFYFVFGFKLVGKGQTLKSYGTVLNLAIPSIVIAHATGRIGCLMAGCCYGKETSSFLGITMYLSTGPSKRLPTQLWESVFLFLLFAFLVYRIYNCKNPKCTPIYLVFYGIFRFLIEFFRDDDRGSLGISWLSPSQGIALLMTIFGVIWLIYLHLGEHKCAS